MVIWFTGLSGAGKTTIASLVYERVKPRLPHLVMLDGDAVREAFGDDLGHTEADRVKQISRVQRFARLLSSQGLMVMVAVVYAHPDLLAWNRRHIPDYFEVFVDAPLDLVRRRDSKGLYGRAARGETHNVVGHDIPWHAPAAPDLILDAGRGLTPLALAGQLVKAIPDLDAAWREEPVRG